jgi:hypothetical protein
MLTVVNILNMDGLIVRIVRVFRNLAQAQKVFVSVMSLLLISYCLNPCVSRLMYITAGGDFLGLCDKKKSI